MTDLTDGQLLLIDLVGDLDQSTADTPLIPEDGLIRTQFQTIWDRYADKATYSPRLRELYVIRDACDLMLGIVAPEVSVTGDGLTVQLQQRFANYTARRKDAQSEIERIEVQIKSSRGPAIGLLTTTAPISPPSPFMPDANDRAYSGDPYYGTRGRPWGRP